MLCTVLPAPFCFALTFGLALPQLFVLPAAQGMPMNITPYKA